MELIVKTTSWSIFGFTLAKFGVHTFCAVSDAQGDSKRCDLDVAMTTLIVAFRKQSDPRVEVTPLPTFDASPDAQGQNSQRKILRKRV